MESGRKKRAEHARDDPAWQLGARIWAPTARPVLCAFIEGGLDQNGDDGALAEHPLGERHEARLDALQIDRRISLAAHTGLELEIAEKLITQRPHFFNTASRPAWSLNSRVIWIWA